MNSVFVSTSQLHTLSQSYPAPPPTLPRAERQHNRVWYIHIMGAFHASKGCSFQNLFIILSIECILGASVFLFLCYYTHDICRLRCDCLQKHECWCFSVTDSESQIFKNQHRLNWVHKWSDVLNLVNFTVLIRCMVWCDWFLVSKRTDSWPKRWQNVRTIFGVQFGKNALQFTNSHA